MDRSKVICRCFNVSVGDIEDAVKSGDNTFEAVQAKTGCASGCGCCKQDVIDLIKELNK